MKKTLQLFAQQLAKLAQFEVVNLVSDITGVDVPHTQLVCLTAAFIIRRLAGTAKA